MATSSTFAYSPSLGDLFIQAFGRCQIRRGQITAEHLEDARHCANLLQVEWSNKGVNMWTVELVTTSLVVGTATYNVDAKTIGILAAYITDVSEARDRVILSIGRDDYAAFPDKTTNGTPTVYWFNRQVSPTITLWQPPDTADQLKYYRARQVQDAAMAGGLTPEVPYRFLEAYTAGLAGKIAQIYPPQDVALRAEIKEQAAISFGEAAAEDTEDTPMRIAPALSGYYRGT